jgi:hypothetical protein
MGTNRAQLSKIAPETFRQPVDAAKTALDPPRRSKPIFRISSIKQLEVLVGDSPEGSGVTVAFGYLGPRTFRDTAPQITYLPDWGTIKR